MKSRDLPTLLLWAFSTLVCLWIITNLKVIPFLRYLHFFFLFVFDNFWTGHEIFLNLLQNTMVMGYVGDIHRSKKYWAKPYEFYPEHFLDDNGLLRKNVEGYLPFSTGKIVFP